MVQVSVADLAVHLARRLVPLRLELPQRILVSHYFLRIGHRRAQFPAQLVKVLLSCNRVAQDDPVWLRDKRMLHLVIFVLVERLLSATDLPRRHLLLLILDQFVSGFSNLTMVGLSRKAKIDNNKSPNFPFHTEGFKTFLSVIYT